MKMDKLIEEINKTIKKHQEEKMIQLLIKDYDKSNFYIALVFNKKIEKFKMLFAHLDGVKKQELIEEYFCYQFVNVQTTNYILETMKHLQEEQRKNVGEEIKEDASYYIEIQTYAPLKVRNYKFIQYIDESFDSLFGVITSIFSYLPNSANEIGRRLLTQFNTKYELMTCKKSITFRLLKDDLSKLIKSENFKYHEHHLDFLESVGGKYYAIVDGKRFLLENKIDYLNIYSEGENPLGEEVYLIIQAIREGKEKKFNRVEYLDKEETYYFFCYGIDFDTKRFLLFNPLKDHEITLKDLESKKLKIKKIDKKLKQEIITYIEEKYIEEKQKEIIEIALGE